MAVLSFASQALDVAGGKAARVDPPVSIRHVRRPRISARRSPELPLRPVLLVIALAVGLAGTARAQSTICRDGTVLTGANARALCAAHGGLPLNPFTSDTSDAAPPRPPSANP